MRKQKHHTSEQLISQVSKGRIRKGTQASTDPIHSNRLEVFLSRIDVAMILVMAPQCSSFIRNSFLVEAATALGRFSRAWMLTQIGIGLAILKP